MNTTTLPRTAVAAPAVVRYGVGRLDELGSILVAQTTRGVCGLYFVEGGRRPAFDLLRRDRPGSELVPDDAAVAAVVARTREFVFDGRPWDDMPLDLTGTPFQIRVWDALRAIPRGQTLTYAELGIKLGLPAGAARAVGSACGSNRVSLLIPCHRVVRTGGGLGGYYWGLPLKQRLLEIEGAAPAGLFA